MRIKRSRIEAYKHMKRIMGKDAEGGSYTRYGAATAFSGEIWPASGRIQSEQYGERLSYIRNIKIDGRYETVTGMDGLAHYVFENGIDLTEGDGLCLYSDAEPDYRVISVKPYRYLTVEAERILK